jgi:hypothetical protein
LLRAANLKEELHFLFPAPHPLSCSAFLLRSANMKDELHFVFHAPLSFMLPFLFPASDILLRAAI